MKLSREQIKALNNPYLDLGEADKLAENQEQLNSLSTKEKKEVAIKLVLNCPEKELTHLGHAIKALKAPLATEETFQHIINQIWEIRKRIVAIKDPFNKKPHNLLLAPEFNMDLFIEFNSFILKLLEGNEKTIAQKLALSTPKEQRSQLVRNIQTTFPHSTFATVLSGAFAFRSALDMLLGVEPYKFFISPEFNVESYVQYDELLTLIDDKEEDIAKKLAQTPEVKRYYVLANLELMFPGSILLEKTKIAFKATIKPTIPSSSMFTPIMKENCVEPKAQDEAGLRM